MSYEAKPFYFLAITTAKFGTSLVLNKDKSRALSTPCDIIGVSMLFISYCKEISEANTNLKDKHYDKIHPSLAEDSYLRMEAFGRDLRCTRTWLLSL